MRLFFSLALFAAVWSATVLIAPRQSVLFVSTAVGVA